MRTFIIHLKNDLDESSILDTIQYTLNVRVSVSINGALCTIKFLENIDNDDDELLDLITKLIQNV